VASTLHDSQPVPKAGRFLGVFVAHLVAVGGCYNPDVKDCTVQDCTVQCAAKTDCTGGQTCVHGWCAMPNVEECPKGGASGDNDFALDAATLTTDASTLCQEGCTNGTCVDGVCTIDCAAPYSCPNDITCPPNLPCRVLCGEHSCGHKVLCGLSSSCEVQCTGDYSCADEIICNANRCDVDCTGVSSCKRRTKCSGSCACDVSCLGAGSCVEVSECPDSTCKLGNGCSSQLTGCSNC
jgi:hypothetical protein